MRQQNAAQTLAILFRTGPMKMAALQRESGLSRRTLELILDDLIASGWVTEINSTPVRTVGRPARSFGFRYGAAHLVALQLEAGQIQATVADLAAEVLGERRMTLPIATSRHERLALLDRCVAGLLGAAGVERSSVVAVTVSTPGIVQDDGTIDLPMTMPDWTGFSLSDAVGQLFDCPVRVENDAKLAALGEKWSRDGEVRDFVYVFADEARIGIGLVVQNELYRGRDGGAGEITWAPQLGLHALSSPALDGLDDEDAPAHATAQAIVDAARAGETEALAEIRKVAEALVPAITAIAWLIAPEEIILGGTLGTIQDLLLPALETALEGNDRPIWSKLRGSQFGERSVLTGCLRMCVESLSEDLFVPSRVGAIRPDGILGPGELYADASTG
ncbi:ROK family transcriptional regulator [Pseudolysinimonas kribbensis]